MRDILSRLRASLSPQALLILAVIFMLLGVIARDSGSQDLEQRIARTLSQVDGAGNVEVTIRMQESAEASGVMKREQSVPCGVVAVAQGADDPLVAMQLGDALCALLGLAPNAVSVIAGGR